MTTYSNILGQYDAKAIIDRNHKTASETYSKQEGHVHVPARDYWSWTSVSNAPDHAFADDMTADEIVAQLDAEGWDCEVKLDGYNRPRIFATHRETAAANAAAKAAVENEFADAEQGYLRYGDLPKGGRSYNYREGHYEAGVSCYAAEFSADGSYRIKTTEASKVTQLLAEADDRPVYRLWGVMVGRGSDGEPVIEVERAERI